MGMQEGSEGLERETEDVLQEETSENNVLLATHHSMETPANRC